jgi:hypothetical protein
VGSIDLIAAVPLTTAIAAALATRPGVATSRPTPTITTPIKAGGYRRRATRVDVDVELPRLTVIRIV